MKKYTKHYLVLLCNTLAEHAIEVEERNPYIVEDTGGIEGFWFYDISYIEDDGLIFITCKIFLRNLERNSESTCFLRSS